MEVEWVVPLRVVFHDPDCVLAQLGQSRAGLSNRHAVDANSDVDVIAGALVSSEPRTSVVDWRGNRSCTLGIVAWGRAVLSEVDRHRWLMSGFDASVAPVVEYG